MQECGICGSKLPHEIVGDPITDCLNALRKRIEHLENLIAPYSFKNQTLQTEYDLIAVDNIYTGQIVSWDPKTLKAFTTKDTETYSQIGMAARDIEKDEKFTFCPSMNTDAIHVLNINFKLADQE